MSEEAKLLIRARKLESEALAQIYDEYSPGLYRFAYRRCGEESLAEDCVAETFDRFIRVLSTDKGPHNHLRAYLYRVAHNWIIDYYRKNKVYLVELNDEIETDSSDAPETSAIKNIEGDVLRAALSNLTDSQQQVITLKYLEGWTNKQISEALEKPVGAVKALQNRALASLRRILTEIGHDGR